MKLFTKLFIIAKSRLIVKRAYKRLFQSHLTIKIVNTSKENDEIHVVCKSIMLVNIFVYCFNAWQQMLLNFDMLRWRNTFRIYFFVVSNEFTRLNISQKKVIREFSLIEIISHVFVIENQWRKRVDVKIEKWRIIMSFVCFEHFDLKQFLEFVQNFMMKKLIRIDKFNDDEETFSNLIDDDVKCFVDCLFYRQYQLFCRHLWQHHFINTLFSKHDWKRWAFMFENDDFEIYESITRKYVVKNIHEIIEKSNKHLLQIRKILDSIKNRYYDLMKYMIEWKTKNRALQFRIWINHFNRFVDFIRRQNVKKILLNLQIEKEINLCICVYSKRRRRREIDSEKKKS